MRHEKQFTAKDAKGAKKIKDRLDGNPATVPNGFVFAHFLLVFFASFAVNRVFA